MKLISSRIDKKIFARRIDSHDMRLPSAALRSRCRIAAVDDEGAAGDVGSDRGAQEEDGGGHFVGGSETPQWGALEEGALIAPFTRMTRSA